MTEWTQWTNNIGCDVHRHCELRNAFVSIWVKVTKQKTLSSNTICDTEVSTIASSSILKIFYSFQATKPYGLWLDSLCHWQSQVEGYGSVSFVSVWGLIEFPHNWKTAEFVVSALVSLLTFLTGYTHNTQFKLCIHCPWADYFIKIQWRAIILVNQTYKMVLSAHHLEDDLESSSSRLNSMCAAEGWTHLKEKKYCFKNHTCICECFTSTEI